MTRTILIEPRDPLIFRDARPAEASLPIRSLDWPLPSSVAGAIRTRLGRLTGYDAETVEGLKNVEHVGPVLAIRKGKGWELAFPAPADAVEFQGNGGPDIVRLRPPSETNADEGCNVPGGLVPLFGRRGDGKPRPGSPFWSAEATLDWLADRMPGPNTLCPEQFLRQRRTHVKIDPNTFAAAEGELFTTEGIEFAWEAGEESQSGAICSQIRTDDTRWASLDAVAPLGGERRLAYWSEPAIAWPSAPIELAATEWVRLQLITPAAFSKRLAPGAASQSTGWKPGWLNDANEGSPPGFPDLGLKLVAAAVKRPVPHSGWDMTKPAARAQKATRFLAPAGSVYFFKASKKIDARSLWLRSIGDDPQDRRDGFGVVLCGGWKWQSE